MSMNDENIITFRYELSEVVSAQRMRFISTPQVWIILLFGLSAAVVVLIIEYNWPIQREVSIEPWVVPSMIAGIFLGVYILLYLFAPVLDFYLNPAWKNEFRFEVDNDYFYYTHSKADTLFRVNWTNISKILENDKVYLLFLGSVQSFVIVPKRKIRSENSKRKFIENLQFVNKDRVNS